MAQDEESRSLLKTVLGYFARKGPEATPTRQQIFMRTDAYLQDDLDEYSDIQSDQVARTLSALEKSVHTPRIPGNTKHFSGPYPKLQAIRNIAQRPEHSTNTGASNFVRIKRKRDTDVALEEISNIERQKRRVISREEPNLDGSVGEGDADYAMQLRKHSTLLDNALRSQWICVCQQCSGLSLRLSLPQLKTAAQGEISFEVFFGGSSMLAPRLQEAKITIKDPQNPLVRRASDSNSDALPVRICQSITDSRDQRYCLHLALENGVFTRLRPQPKNFGDIQAPRTISLSSIFKRQQELRPGLLALPLKGRRILAVTLATALLPFLETSWMQPSFNHSKVQFFQPLEDGALPNIAKPFLAMEHMPIVPASRTSTGISAGDPAGSRDLVHPNASVMALGILLCELQYCTPIERLNKDTENPRTVNTDYFTSLDILADLEPDAGNDYYLATKACLKWEYYPDTGELADFDSASVQRLFYQNVVKRLENEIFKSWGHRFQDLSSLPAQDHEACWGNYWKNAIRQQAQKATSPPQGDAEGARLVRSASEDVYPTRMAQDASILLHMSSNSLSSPKGQVRPTRPSGNGLYFFDASHQVGSVQGAGLSEQWMENLCSSIYGFLNLSDTPAIGFRRPEPVRIAILDSGFDPSNPLLMDENGRLNPQIKQARSFVHNTEAHEFQDDIGHGSHTLGLLLKVAPCAEIYIAKIAGGETLNRDSYDDIAKAINHAVSEWNVDVISMSFGIRDYHGPFKSAIADASHKGTLMFAAASNDGGNSGRAFPAASPGVFCIHSTNGNGSPSDFNPTAHDKDINFSLLGEDVSSHWPAGKNGHNAHVKVMSGTSIATPIAAGLVASILSFVRQQESGMVASSELLSTWLKDSNSMDVVLKTMVRRERQGFGYITPHELLDVALSKQQVYDRIRELKRKMYS